MNRSLIFSYIITIIFSTCIGTFLDCILVEQGFYSFPVRPFPTIFHIDIFFTLFFLPVATLVYLLYANKVNSTLHSLTIIMVGALVPWVEEILEKWGWFVHSGGWKHIYSFYGYMIYLWLVWGFYRWLTQIFGSSGKE